MPAQSPMFEAAALDEYLSNCAASYVVRSNARRFLLQRELYEKVREKYNCAEHFPHLYDKTSGCQSFDWREELELENRNAGVHDKKRAAK